MRPHSRATIDPSNPRAVGTCDRCGFWYNLDQLHYQHQWSGTQLINMRLRVCDICMDEPSMHLKTVILPPDPVPVHDARPEPYEIDEA